MLDVVIFMLVYVLILSILNVKTRKYVTAYFFTISTITSFISFIIFLVTVDSRFLEASIKTIIIAIYNLLLAIYEFKILAEC